jgi:hypothetical protein
MGSSQSCSDTGLDGTPDGLRTAKAQHRDQAILIVLQALDDFPPYNFHRSIALKFFSNVRVAMADLRQNHCVSRLVSGLRHRQHTPKSSTICTIHFGD